jgi:hypothetical protein
MNIQADQLDLDLVREAKRIHDWHVLTTWKQRFIYQRYVALPEIDIVSVKEISEMASELLNKQKEETIGNAQMIFNPEPI